MILRFQQGGCDLSQLSDAAGGQVRIASASPVMTSIALSLPDGADAEAVKAEMRNQGWYYVDESPDCPLIMSGEDQTPYRVSVSAGEFKIEPVEG